MADDIEFDAKSGQDEFPDETPEEAVARIVAQNPAKHGTTLETRLERARAAVTRMLAAGADLSNLSAEDATIVAIGGDPNEMMVGNKPRYTVQEDGSVKDHETGEVHLSGNGSMDSVLEGTEVAQEHAGEDATQAPAGVQPDPATCPNTWPEDPDEDTRCPLCQMTFEEWVNS